MLKHAIVIGGSIAGLLSARVLCDYFEEVTIIERDQFPAGPEARKGVPQARHIHILLTTGQTIMEQLFPGLFYSLEKDGAQKVDWGYDCVWMFEAGPAPRFHSNVISYSSSRDLLEWHIRTCLRENPHVHFLEKTDVTGLISTPDRKQVIGVHIHYRGAGETSQNNENDILAQLIVDASGRTSQCLAWLEMMGYPPPQETVVNSFQGYASRWYQPVNDINPDWKVLVVRPKPPHISRAGGIYCIEGGNWIVTLGGVAQDCPPTDEKGFLEFARGLNSPVIYDAIQSAKPFSPIYGFRRTENRFRHFEKMPRWPEHFIIVGDAVCTFNPVYGQGMSAAAQDARILNQCLDRLAFGSEDPLSGLPRLFQTRLAQANSNLWLMATGEDYRWPSTEGPEPGLAMKLMHRYLDRLMAQSLNDPQVRQAFLEVAHLEKTPKALFTPVLIRKALLSIQNKQRIIHAEIPEEAPPPLL